MILSANDDHWCRNTFLWNHLLLRHGIKILVLTVEVMKDMTMDHAMIVSSVPEKCLYMGDPYGNFNLKINAGNGAGDDPIIGKGLWDYGAVLALVL